MDRVIPKDVVDLIYKESHLDKTIRLNAEYLELFEPVRIRSFFGNYFVRYKINHFGYGFRLSYIYGYKIINTFRNGKVSWNAADLPKRYFYSSGNNELKWIE